MLSHHPAAAALSTRRTQRQRVAAQYRRSPGVGGSSAPAPGRPPRQRGLTPAPVTRPLLFLARRLFVSRRLCQISGGQTRLIRPEPPPNEATADTVGGSKNGGGSAPAAGRGSLRAGSAKHGGPAPATTPFTPCGTVARAVTAPSLPTGVVRQRVGSGGHRPS